MASMLALSATACNNSSGGKSKDSTAESTASADSDSSNKDSSESSNEDESESSNQQSAQEDSKTDSLEYWTEDSPAMKSIMEYVSAENVGNKMYIHLVKFRNLNK